MEVSRLLYIRLIIGFTFYWLAQYFEQAYANSVTITKFKASSNRQYLDISFAQHTNSNRFDINFTLLQPIYENQYFVNIRLKAKIRGYRGYRNIHTWTRIEGCSVIKKVQDNKLYNNLFKIAPHRLEHLQCPLKVGLYQCKDIELEQTPIISAISSGEYRIILDSMGSEITKPLFILIALLVD